MTSNLRIAPINFHDQAIVAASSEVGDLVITDTQNVARGLIWRGDVASLPVTITGNLQGDGVRRVNCFSIFRHNLFQRKIQLELLSGAGLSGSVVYDSTAINVPGPILSSGYDWGYTPNTALTDSKYDPLYSESPYVLYFPEATIGSYRITITNNGGPLSSSDTLDACRIFLGQYVEFEMNPEPGTSLTMGWETNSSQGRTWGGSLRTNAKSRWKSLSFNLGMVFESQRPTLLDMMAICELKRDVMVSLHPGDGTRLERDHCMNAKFSSMDALSRDYSFSTKKISLLEV